MQTFDFTAVVEDYGIEQALRSYRAYLVRMYDDVKDFRWFGQRWARAIDNLDFEARYLAEHGYCHMFNNTYYADGKVLSGRHYN